ncbi:MAG: VOC family protein [Myxococcota bacterium]
MPTPYSFTKLVVHDLEGMSVYYQRAYGLKPFGRVQADIAGDAIDEIFLGVDGPHGPGALTLLQFPDRPAPTPGAIVLGFVTEDLDALVADVEAAGGAVHDGIRSSEAAPVRVAFTADPEGNLAENVQVMGGA